MTVRVTVLASALAVATGCGETQVKEQQSSQAGHAARRTIGELSPAAKTGLASLRIFFGHQSVGSNIVEGVADLARADPELPLQIVGLDAAGAGNAGFFAHDKIGQNGNPLSKTDEFARRMEAGLASRVDVAFHKYCYIDIDDRSDAAALFSRYRQTMDRLRSEFPAVTFVHVTVPLTHVQRGLKVPVKKLLGRPPGGYADNLRREEFNELMRREYGGREPLFDLAAVESTTPDGRQEMFSFKGQTGRALFPPYGSDGRHLNEAGRRRVAEELLVMLATLPGWGKASPAPIND